MKWLAGVCLAIILPKGLISIFSNIGIEWVGRLIVSVLLTGIFTIGFLTYSIVVKYNPSKSKQTKLQFNISKYGAMIISLVFTIYLCPPLIRDLVYLYNNDVIEIIETVSDADGTSSRSGYLGFQTVKIKSQDSINSFTIYYGSYWIREGNTSKFSILPYSKLILEAEQL